MSANYVGNVPFVAHARCTRGMRWCGTFPYHLFSLTLVGGATYDLPDGRVEITAGDLLHFAPRAMQDWQVTGQQGWKVGYLIVSLPAAMGSLLPPPNLAPGIGRIRLERTETARMARIFHEMQAWSERSTPLREQLVLNLLEYILLSLRSLQPVSAVDGRIALAREFLHGAIEEPIVLADVVRASGLSRARLCTLFKEHLDTTPMVYLERLRLEQAARLILFTADPIGVIAERLGYSDRGYFDKRFKRRWGLTPRAYRLAGADGSGPTQPQRQ